MREKKKEETKSVGDQNGLIKVTSGFGASQKKCVEHVKISYKRLLCLDVGTWWNSTYLMLDASENFETACKTLNLLFS